METVKAKIKGTNAILEGCVCDDSFFVSVDHDIFERYSLCEVEICKDSLQVPETCKENQDSFTSLEEAAARYEQENRQSILSSVDIVDAFIAGAEWQKEQMMDEWLKDRDGCFWDGVNEGKKAMEEQMMKDVVEAEITVGRLPDDWSLAYNPDELHRALLKFKSGDKVKIIIVKKD